jgi:hypothetical protein
MEAIASGTPLARAALTFVTKPLPRTADVLNGVSSREVPMVKPITAPSPPIEVEVIPSVPKPRPIPSHGFAVEDTVTLHDKELQEGKPK